MVEKLRSAYGCCVCSLGLSFCLLCSCGEFFGPQFGPPQTLVNYSYQHMTLTLLTSSDLLRAADDLLSHLDHLRIVFDRRENEERRGPGRTEAITAEEDTKVITEARPPNSEDRTPNVGAPRSAGADRGVRSESDHVSERGFCGPRNMESQIQSCCHLSIQLRDRFIFIAQRYHELRSRKNMDFMSWIR